MQNFFSIGQVADQLGVPQHQIAYAHVSRKVPEPEKVLGRRAYRQKDIEQLRQFFAAQRKRKEQK
jgi:DNA-binding transcriptional MerR regulator